MGYRRIAADNQQAKMTQGTRVNRANFLSGYILASRSLLDSPIWRASPDLVKLWLYLVLSARHSSRAKRYPDGVEVRQGELLTSLSKLAEANEWVERGVPRRWSRQKVARMLKILNENDSIELLPDTYGTHIKVINYVPYQTPANYRADRRGTVTDSCGTPPGTNKNENKGENGKNGTHNVPDNILPDTRQFCSWWAQHKAPVSVKFMSYVNAAFQDRVPLRFALDVGKKLRATMDPWDLAARLVSEWRHIRQFESERAKVYRPATDPRVRALVEQSSRNASVST